MAAGIRAPETIETGDVITIHSVVSPFHPGEARHAVPALVMSELDKRGELTAFEIVPAQEADKHKRSYVVMQGSDMLSHHGLSPNKDWAILIHPIPVPITERGTMRKDGMINYRGTVQDHPALQRLGTVMDNLRDQEYSQDRAIAQGWVTSNWQKIQDSRVFFPDRDQPLDEAIVRPHENRTGKIRPRSKNKGEGQVHNITLENAAKVGLISEELAGFFERPADKRIKPVASLKELYELARIDGGLEKYLPKENKLTRDVALADLTEEIHVGTINGLATPRQGAPVKPLTQLSEAYALYTQRPPEEAYQYYFVTPANYGWRRAEVVQAYESRVSKTPAVDVNATAQTIKDAWSQYGEDTIQAIRGNIPERYQAIFSSDRDFMMKLVR